VLNAQGDATNGLHCLGRCQQWQFFVVGTQPDGTGELTERRRQTRANGAYEICVAVSGSYSNLPYGYAFTVKVSGNQSFCARSNRSGHPGVRVADKLTLVMVGFVVIVSA
jgi:hypothetical protein